MLLGMKGCHGKTQRSAKMDVKGTAYVEELTQQSTAKCFVIGPGLSKTFCFYFYFF